MSDRMKEMKGSLKEAAGKAVGNERLEAEGTTERTAAKTKREASGAMDQVGGNVKMGVGKAVGNKRLHAEGQADDLKGTAKRIG